ncbi:MAG: sensor histidine kinase, partial [Patescibacteria group bacterium]
YAIIRYDLMNIRVIAKRALLYSVIVVAATMVLGAVIFTSRFLEDSYPMLSIWLIPAILSILGVILGAYIWKGMRDAESMKYEFITTVTHKFRTPLSRIVWAVEGIREEGGLTDFQKSGIRSIDYSTRSILKMVDLMTNLSDNKASKMEKNIDLTDLMNSALDEVKSEFSRRNITLESDIEEGITVFAEKSSIRFIINVLLENAMIYTPNGGTVNIDLYNEDNKAVIRVKDNGIGMSKKTQERVSDSFFRGNDARITDTEGMGVGLYVVKKVANGMEGEMDFHSDGVGEGSTFFVRLPVVRE